MSTALHEISGEGGWAIPYRNKRRRKAFRLVSGMIIEDAAPEEVAHHLPRTVPPFFEMTTDGSREVKPQEVSPESVFIRLRGVFLLRAGEVAAVYGGKAEAIEPDRTSAPSD
jgi:hypothetical protein